MTCRQFLGSQLVIQVSWRNKAWPLKTQVRTLPKQAEKDTQTVSGAQRGSGRSSRQSANAIARWGGREWGKGVSFFFLLGSFHGGPPVEAHTYLTLHKPFSYWAWIPRILSLELNAISSGLSLCFCFTLKLSFLIYKIDTIIASVIISTAIKCLSASCLDLGLICNQVSKCRLFSLWFISSFPLSRSLPPAALVSLLAMALGLTHYL